MPTSEKKMSHNNISSERRFLFVSCQEISVKAKDRRICSCTWLKIYQSACIVLKKNQSSWTHYVLVGVLIVQKLTPCSLVCTVLWRTERVRHVKSIQTNYFVETKSSTEPTVKVQNIVAYVNAIFCDGEVDTKVSMLWKAELCSTKQKTR